MSALGGGLGRQGEVRGHDPQLPGNEEDARLRLGQQGRRLLTLPSWLTPAGPAPRGSRAAASGLRQVLACRSLELACHTASQKA